MPDSDGWHYAPEALSDLISAAQYLDEKSGSTTAGDRLFEIATQTCDHIARLPSIGKQRDDLEPGLRSFPLDRFPYLILYRILVEDVEIARILHERMDIAEEFNRKGRG